MFMMPILMCHRCTSTQIDGSRLYDFGLLVWKMRYAMSSLYQVGSARAYRHRFTCRLAQWSRMGGGTQSLRFSHD
jgi:hypothetical protein